MNAIASAIMSSSAMAPGTATPGAVPGATADPKSPPSFEALSSDPRGSSFVGATSLMSPVRRTPRYGPGMFNGPLVGAPHSVRGAVSPPIHEAASRRKVLEPGHQSRDPLSELPVVRAPSQPVLIAQYEAMDAYRRTGTNLPGPGSLGKKGAAGEPREILAVVGPSGTGGSQVASSFGMPHHEVAHANRGGSYVGGRVGGGRWIPRNVVSSKRRRGSGEDRRCNPSVDPRTGERVTASQAALDHAKREIRAGLRTVDGRVVRGGRSYADAGDVPLLDPKGEGTGSAPIDIQPSARVSFSPPAPTGKGQIPTADLSGLHATTQVSASQREEVSKLRVADLEDGLRLAGQGKLLSPLIQGRRTTSGCLQLRDLQARQASPARTLAAVAKQLPPEGAPAPGKPTKEAAARSRGSQERLYRRAAASIVSDRRAGTQDGACLVPDRHPTRPGAYPRTIEGTDQLQAQPTGGAITSDAPGAKVSPMPTDSRAPHGQAASAAQSGAPTRPDEFAGLMTPQMPAPATAATKPNTPRGKPVVGPRGKGGGGGDALWLTIGNTAARAEAARQNAHRYARGLKAALDTYGSQLVRTKTSTESSRQIIKSLAAVQTSLNQLRDGRNEKNPDFAARAAESQRLLGQVETLRKHAAIAQSGAKVTGAARRVIELYASGLERELRRYHSDSTQLQEESAKAGNQNAETTKRRIQEAMGRSQKQAIREQRRLLRRNLNSAYLTRQFARTKAARNRQAAAFKQALKYRTEAATGDSEGARENARIRADYYEGVAQRAGEEASVARSWVAQNTLSQVPGYRKWVQQKRREQRKEQRETAGRNRKLDRKHRQLSDLQARLAAAKRRLQQSWEGWLEQTDSKARERKLAAIQATRKSLESKIARLEDEIEQLSKPATASKRDPAEPGRDPDAQTRGPVGQESDARQTQEARTPNRNETGDPRLSPEMQDLVLYKAEKKSQLGADSEAWGKLERLLDKQIDDQALADVLDATANITALGAEAESLSAALHQPNLTEAERDGIRQELEAVLKAIKSEVERAFDAAMQSGDLDKAWAAFLKLLEWAGKLLQLAQDPCVASGCAAVKAACEAQCNGTCECKPKPTGPQPGVDYGPRPEQPDGSDPDSGDSAGSGEGKQTRDDDRSKGHGGTGEGDDVAGGDGSAKPRNPPDSETTIEIAPVAPTTETTDGAAGDKNALKGEDQEGADSQSSIGGTGHDGGREGDASIGGSEKEERGSYTSGKKPRTKKAKQDPVESNRAPRIGAWRGLHDAIGRAVGSWTSGLLEMQSQLTSTLDWIDANVIERAKKRPKWAIPDWAQRKLVAKVDELYRRRKEAEAGLIKLIIECATREEALRAIEESIRLNESELANVDAVLERVWSATTDQERLDLVLEHMADWEKAQFLRMGQTGATQLLSTEIWSKFTELQRGLRKRAELIESQLEQLAVAKREGQAGDRIEFGNARKIIAEAAASELVKLRENDLTKLFQAVSYEAIAARTISSIDHKLKLQADIRRIEARVKWAELRIRDARAALHGVRADEGEYNSAFSHLRSKIAGREHRQFAEGIANLFAAYPAPDFGGSIETIERNLWRYEFNVVRDREITAEDYESSISNYQKWSTRAFALAIVAATVLTGGAALPVIAKFGAGTLGGKALTGIVYGLMYGTGRQGAQTFVTGESHWDVGEIALSGASGGVLGPLAIGRPLVTMTLGSVGMVHGGHEVAAGIETGDIGRIVGGVYDIGFGVAAFEGGAKAHRAKSEARAHAETMYWASLYEAHHGRGAPRIGPGSGRTLSTRGGAMLPEGSVAVILDSALVARPGATGSPSSLTVTHGARAQRGAGSWTVVAPEVPGVMNPPQHVLLDTTAVIAQVERGAEVLRGRRPVLSTTVVKQFIRDPNRRNVLSDELRGFLSTSRGKLVPDGTEATVGQLQARAQELGRSLSTTDARIGGAAIREGLPVITSDKRFRNFLRAIGYPVEGH